MKYSQLPIKVVVLLLCILGSGQISIVVLMYQQTIEGLLAKFFIQHLGNAQFEQMTLCYVTSEFL